MPVPTPRPGESESDYMGRCMGWMHDNDPERSQDQMVAICMRQFRDKANTASDSLSFVRRKPD